MSYEERKAARIARLRARAEKKRAFADQNDLSLFGGAKSGIPLGQPILVGHHSERRHRRHLERIENRVRKGYEAGKEADQLEARADAAENRKAIDVDNPEAKDLLAQKIAKLEDKRTHYKTINVLVRKFKTVEALSAEIKRVWPETKDPEKLATGLLTPDFAGRVGIPSFTLTNLGAEIRRLKKRQEVVEKVQGHVFEDFEVTNDHGTVSVSIEDGRVVVKFPYKPNDETRSRLKRSPLALKWSSYGQAWVRKHTDATLSQWFRETLREVLETSAP